MSFEQLAEIIRSRRTNLMIDRERDVDAATIAKLCDVAVWAPNHKLTWPWLFCEVRGAARRQLGDACADVMAAQNEPSPRVQKTRGKFERSPVVLVVGSEAGDTELRTAENRDAVSAAVQNVLLGATALGLASFWSSCPTGANDAVAKFCGFPSGTTIVAMIYLGWPTDVPKGFERPAPRITQRS